MTKVEITNKSKKWYQSKTMWAGILEITSGLALTLADYLATGGALTAVGIAKVILRYITNTEVEL